MVDACRRVATYDAQEASAVALYPKKLPPHFENRDLISGGLLTIAQTMTLLGRSRRTIYYLMDHEKLPFVVIPGLRGRRIPREACRILIELAEDR
jgi:excisionase family DNA binding protein